MCIVHKGFRGFRAVSPASILGGNLTGLKPEIPYDTIHSTLFSNGENIEIENLKQGLSYVIDVTDGEIMYLEFTTYGENWNGIFGDYKIVEKSENQ